MHMKQMVYTDGSMNHLMALFNVGARLPFLVQYLKGKTVLHVGCTDYPRFDPRNNLHIQLSREIENLHGMDIDARGIEILRQHVPGRLYSDYSQIDQFYDTVLVPEVIEHTLNPGLFLKAIFSIQTKEIILLAPNAIEVVKQNAERFGWIRTKESKEPRYLETVHQDHTTWYSPKTLSCLVEKAITEYQPGQWNLHRIFLCDLSVGCIIART